jgi:hypothetical protein
MRAFVDSAVNQAGPKFFRAPKGQELLHTSVAEDLFGPDVANAIRTGIYGPRTEVTQESLYARFAKLVAGSTGYAVEYIERYPGGPAILELRNAGQVSAGRGDPVERNYTRTWKNWPGQPKLNRTGTFAEGVFRTSQVGYGDATRYKFHSLAGLTAFLKEFEDKSKFMSPLRSQFGLRGELDDAYQKYALAHGEQLKAAGDAQELIYSPYAVKFYGSTTLEPVGTYFSEGINKSLRDRLLPSLPEEWRGPAANVLASGVGIYGEAGGSVEFKAGRTRQNVEMGPVFFADDVNPNAPGLALSGRVGGRFFGAMSIGAVAPIELAGLDERSYRFSTGLVFDPHGNAAQTFVGFRQTAGNLSREHTLLFRDGRLNDRREGARVPGLQLLYGNIPVDMATFDVEARWPVNPFEDPADTLLALYIADQEHVRPHFRFKDLGDLNPRYKELFSAEWVHDAKAAYEEAFNGGKPLDDNAWENVLHTQLSWSLRERASYQVNSGPKQDWADRYITPDRIAAYGEWWEKIAKPRIEKEEHKLASLKTYEKYNLFQSRGMRFPATYVTYSVGQETQQLFGGGASFARLPRMSPRNDPNGLYQFRYTGIKGQASQPASLAIAHPGYDSFKGIWFDPVSRPAFAALMNRNAYSPKDPSGRDIFPSPQSAVIWEGTTPTRTIEEIISRSGYRPGFSEINSIYQVRADDLTWADIGRHAFEQLEGKCPTKLVERTYGEWIIKTNFRGLPIGTVQDRLFENAYLILPSPPQ